jgi:hypothetical protein
MKTYTIEVRGKTETDVVYELKEIIYRIERGSLAGFDSNEDGDFDYTSEGDYEEEAEPEDNTITQDH